MNAYELDGESPDDLIASPKQIRIVPPDERRLSAIVLTTGLVLAVVLRAGLVLSGGDFPLNDGGMFYAIVEDIKAANFALPHYTSFNGGDIPLAYPPLGFYVAALLSKAGIDTMALFRWLPLAFSIASVGAFYLLARRFLRPGLTVSIAVLVFAGIPRAFNWEIAGGGLTRSPGLFFALLAIWQGHALIEKGGRRRLVATSVFAALSLLCHLETGSFAACSLLIFFIAQSRNKKAFLRLAGAGFLALVLTAPWWVTILLRFGPAPFLSASSTAKFSPLFFMPLLRLEFTDAAGFPIALALGLLGAAWALKTGRGVLVAWLVLLFLFTPRKAAIFETAPLAMLAAIAVVEILPPIVSRATFGESKPSRKLGYAGLGFLLAIYAPVSAIASASPGSPLTVLPGETRTAMSWVSEHTPREASFLVMPSTVGWWVDTPQEWFPLLARRNSITTVQGSEWLGKDVFAARVEDYNDLARCSATGVDCLIAWQQEGGHDFDYVFVPKTPLSPDDEVNPGTYSDCCAELRRTLEENSLFSRVYDGLGAAVYRVVSR